MSKSLQIVESICEWNAERCVRKYNTSFMLDLLHEEVGELRKAMHENDLVEILDAWGDIFYLAVGGMWKLGETPTTIHGGITCKAMFAYTKDIDMYLENLKLEAPLRNLIGIAEVAFMALTQYAGSEAKAIGILQAICMSNDTKPKGISTELKIQKDEKYVAPTEDIKSII